MIAIDMPSQRQCFAALDTLMSNCEGVVAGMFALRDGRPFAERSRVRVSTGKFAAMNSSLMALAGTVMTELAADAAGHVLIEGKEHKLAVCRAPCGRVELFLAILARNDVNLGLVLGYARTCVREICETRTDAAMQSID